LNDRLFIDRVSNDRVTSDTSGRNRTVMPSLLPLGALLTGTDVDVPGVSADSDGTLSITNGGSMSDGGLNVGQAGTGAVTVNGGTFSTTGTPALAGFAATISGFRTGDQLISEAETIASDSATGSGLDLFSVGGVPLGQSGFDSSAAADAAAADITGDCFAAGTGIATTRGLVPVECVHPGDRVCTVLRGDTAEVIWVGRRKVDCIRHADPLKVWPVRISAHAFGPGMPATDLVLSPDHAVFVDRVLIPIRLLINGRTVRQIPVETVSYYHVELAEHDVLLANGMPAESWLDTGDRCRFSNGGEVIALHPDFSALTREMRGCAPLVRSGPMLEAVRKRLGVEVARRARRPDETSAPGTGWPR
jgi:hypothetical protein